MHERMNEWMNTNGTYDTYAYVDGYLQEYRQCGLSSWHGGFFSSVSFLVSFHVSFPCTLELHSRLAAPSHKALYY